MRYDWAVDQLMKLEKEPLKDWAQDHDSIFLVNPTAEKKIDQLFSEKFYPPISDLFLKTGFSLTQSKDKIKGSIYSGMSFGKEYELIVDDPIRPLKAGFITRNWFSRFNLLLCKTSFSFSTQLRIILNDEFQDKKLIKLLRNPYFDGSPPQLTSTAGLDSNYFTIEFNVGDGFSWSWVNENEAIEIILGKIKRNFSILSFLNENENSLASDKTFQRLENHLVTYFENW